MPTDVELCWDDAVVMVPTAAFVEEVVPAAATLLVVEVKESGGTTGLFVDVVEAVVVLVEFELVPPVLLVDEVSVWLVELELELVLVDVLVAVEVVLSVELIEEDSVVLVVLELVVVVVLDDVVGLTVAVTVWYAVTI